MENENVLSAYHESARVVFAYLNGFACDLIELPGEGSNSNSKLNAGGDLTLVQGVLSGNPLSLPSNQLSQAIEIAKKLMTIYCAGTCAKIYYENNLKVPAELEMDISGQDLTMLKKVQTFLKKAIVDHSDDFPSETIVAVFKKLKEPDVWRAIELLASKVLEQEDKRLKRFYIEDTLMMAGMKIQRPTAKSGFAVGVHEDDDVKPVTQEKKQDTFDLKNSTPLDIIVTDFLKKIKHDWKDEELTAATDYLHGVYKKYGDA